MIFSYSIGKSFLKIVDFSYNLDTRINNRILKQVFSHGGFIHGDYIYKHLLKCEYIDIQNDNRILREVFRNGGFVHGGYVYKHLLRGEYTKDIDVAISSDKLDDLIKGLVEKCNCDINNYKLVDRKYRLTTLTCQGINVDVMDDQITKDYIKRSENHIGKIIFTEKGVTHIDDPQNKDTKLQEEKDKIIQDIRGKKYNHWNDMRPKDLRYFEDWTPLNSRRNSHTLSKADKYGSFNLIDLFFSQELDKYGSPEGILSKLHYMIFACKEDKYGKESGISCWFK